jgi:hypothetical protein
MRRPSPPLLAIPSLLPAVPALLGLSSCSDFGLSTISEPNPTGDEAPGDPAEDATAPEDDPGDDEPGEEDDGGNTSETPPEDDGEPSPEPPPEPELPGCDETIEAAWPWWGSQPFPGADGPVDSAGIPFWDVNFQMIGWSTVSVPDSGHAPPGTDRAYRAEFWLDSLPPALFLSMQSDDGMWFWLNGTLVGHWGGDWQQEGCVNEDAACTESVDVSAVDVTAFLLPGRNVAAARVSNPVMNHWFDVYTECVE